MTTTINNEHKKLNVPNLRFKEFQGELEKCKFRDVCSISTGNKNTQDKIDDGIYPFYVRSQTVERINSWTFDGEAILTAGDGVGVGKVFHHTYGKIGVHQRVYILSDFKCDANYLFHFFSSKFYNRVKRMSAKNSVDSVRKEMITDMSLSLPSHQEQVKIGHLLSLLDERIATQNKIIDKLQSLIKGIAQHCIRVLINGWEYVRLGDICKITTGKLDANAQVENGQYPFFTCAERPFNIDSYAFDTEALLISGNGANLGYINYYKGKFNAYQRTYVLDHFSVNIQYVKWALKVLLPKRIAIEKSSSNTPYIVLSTLADLKIPIPNNSKQNHIANLMQSFERELSNQLALNDLYNKQKQYMLRQMFI